MPLKPGNNNDTVGENIVELMGTGRPRNQAIAIAMKKAGLSRSLIKNKPKKKKSKRHAVARED